MGLIKLDASIIFKKGQETIMKKCQDNLAATDYLCNKFADQALTAEEYEPMRLKRVAWRAAYNAAQVATTQAELDVVVIPDV